MFGVQLDDGQITLNMRLDLRFKLNRFRNRGAEVMRRGWHQNRFIGGKLRWLGKYLP